VRVVPPDAEHALMARCGSSATSPFEDATPDEVQRALLGFGA
jgi:CDGSH-type Zn-finger protein